MKATCLLIAFFSTATTFARPVPSPALLERLNADGDVIGIVHWGLNTYTDREWGFGDENPADLNPAKFDADQIVQACAAGGLKGLVIVAKHHDGFCLWPTKTTGHNITKSPFRGGKGDYVREMADACRRAGMKFGVYVSPWDRNNAAYGTAKYVDLYHAQIKELLGGDYGEVFEMWFDGANGGNGYYGGAREKRKIPNGYYRFDEVFEFVRELQPKVCIFAGEHDAADFRWPGNEKGFLDPDSRATVCTVGGYADGKYGNPDYGRFINTGCVDGRFFKMCEADFPLRTGWFYHVKERGKSKHAAYLMNRYLSSVGNGGIMNIGISPNKDGLLDEEDVKALKGFKAIKDAFFARKVDSRTTAFNAIVMKEDLSAGEQVEAWNLEVDGRSIASGKSIGHKRIRVFDKPIKGVIRVRATCGTRPVGVSAACYSVDSELVKLVRSAATESGETDTAKWMTGVEKESASAKPGVKATVRGAERPRIISQWKGKKVAFLGDSITDRNHVGCRRNYWNFLPEELGIDAYVYGRNGWQMGGTYGLQKQAEKLKAELGDEVDAIFVFAGTNDYNSNVPLGEWYSVAETNVCRGGPPVKVSQRQVLLDDGTFRGRINILLAYLKREFPFQQVVLLTPIHRAFAQFGPRNVQPDESFSNAIGLFIDDYVKAVREAGSVWSVPVIDLFADSGLYPREPAQAVFFHNEKTDMLHPNTDGQRRMALAIQYRMLALPSDFKNDAKAASNLEVGFLKPPHEAKPHTWYHMMNGNVTKDGITHDFEALAEIGVGGVQMFDAGCEIPPGPVKFNSPEWFGLLKHAATEAKRLGLEICIPNCSGWSSSGGPWVKPEDGMMVLDSTRTEVLTGPTEFLGKLARPPFASDHAKFYRDLAVIAVPVPEAETRTFPGESKSLDGLCAAFEAAEPVTAGGIEFRYRYDRTYGIYGKLLVETSGDGLTFAELGRFESNPCVMCIKDESLRTLRFPKRVTFKALRVRYLFESGSLLEANLRITDLRPTDRVELSLARAKRFEVRNDVVRDDFPTTPDQVVASARCVSLTDRMKPDGTLAWSVPAGKWRICRIGYKANGRRNHPASGFGVGLEVDKLSAAALGRHFDNYVGRLCDHLGPDLCGDHPYGLNNILVDSYEVGSQNWTPGFERLFRERMGYDLAPYWPVLLGYVVDSTDVSERFLEDYRRLICDLFAENYAGALAKKCHARGLQLSLEPYGNSPSDDLQYGASADIPMGEFWSHARNPWPNACGNVKFVSSLAHVWGRRFVGAEAFTASGSRPGGGDNGPGSGGWMTTPFDLKAQGDTAFCSGVNRIIYHRFVHQPWTDVPRLPGMTMGKWGMHFDRTQTWWKEGAEWIRYQSRCQWMLQQGDFVADFLVFCGEETPNRGGDNTDSSKLSPAAGIPAGYDWDIATREAVKALKVENGLMVALGGTKYRVLVLPASDTMSPEMLGEIGRLIDAGVTVVGPKRPVRAPGLRDAAVRDAETRHLADEVWTKGVHPSIAAALSAIRLEPDCTLTYGKTKDAIAPHWIHRRDGKSDWYFIAANNREPMTFTASLRGDFPTVELWDPEKGTVVRAAHVRRAVGRTEVTFDLPIAGSVFAVGRTSSSAPLEKKPVVAEEVPVEGAWQVSFPNEFKPNALAKGADEAVTFETLVDWATHADERIRGFSGSAVYRKTVRLDDATWTAVTSGASRIVLDLGDVKHFATVTVNGRTYPALWKPPYRLDITEALVASPSNQTIEQSNNRTILSVRVTNLWANKLIADDKKPEDCEWTESRIHGDAIKGIPAWVNEGRPSPTGRDTFVTWRHWRGTDRPQPSGLIGPVKIVRMK